ncbi:MAG: c-type cytochrome [Deltaproteobacteria bacterium]|nr:c-type cytochrome [Deltaproteobacteria bacterium]
MSAPELNQIRDHEFDGIKEYDNPTPRWWTWVFVVSIAFSLVYFVWYHLGGPGPSAEKEYETEMAEAKAKGRGGAVGATAVATEAELAALGKDPAAIEAAKGLFAKNCVACHGEKGEGKIGPNLTDDFYLHGGRRADLFKVIRDGVPAKGMIPWGTALKPEELKQLAVYVASLRGTNPPNGKAAQGEKAAPLEAEGAEKGSASDAAVSGKSPAAEGGG